MNVDVGMVSMSRTRGRRLPQTHTLVLPNGLRDSGLRDGGNRGGGRRFHWAFPNPLWKCRQPWLGLAHHNLYVAAPLAANPHPPPRELTGSPYKPPGPCSRTRSPTPRGCRKAPAPRTSFFFKSVPAGSTSVGGCQSVHIDLFAPTSASLCVDSEMADLTTACAVRHGESSFTCLVLNRRWPTTSCSIPLSKRMKDSLNELAR